MPFSRTNSAPSREFVGILAITTAMVVAVGVAKEYSFFPDRELDAFLLQIEYASRLVEAGDWAAFVDDPLSLIHLLRYVVIWPFVTAERAFGSAGSLALLLLLLWPLLIVFRPQRGDWRDIAYVAIRLLVLLLPLVVSGRTVIVAAGMGYLVSGIMMRPFSGWRMLIGCAAAVLSSASVLFSIAVLFVAGNWQDRSRAFYAAKAFFIILVGGLLAPSLFAKAEGFSNGAVGYAIEEPGAAGANALSLQDDAGTGPIALVQRILVRSTVVESYREGNSARLALYVALFAAAWAYVLWSAAVRHWHPLLVVLVVLSGGIFLEGLALWPVLFPLMWAYTGIVRTDRTVT